MSERVLVDGLGYEIAVGSEEELRRGLDEIDTAARGRGRPLIATLFANATEDDPPSLGIGLGGRDSVLIYSAGGWSGEGGCSVGPRVGDHTETPFGYGDTVNVYLGWMLIPTATASAAVVEFFHTGQQPTSIPWGDPAD